MFSFKKLFTNTGSQSTADGDTQFGSHTSLDVYFTGGPHPNDDSEDGFEVSREDDGFREVSRSELVPSKSDLRYLPSVELGAPPVRTSPLTDGAGKLNVAREFVLREQPGAHAYIPKVLQDLQMRMRQEEAEAE